MSPKAHTRKVTGKATEKKSKSPFRCEQCGKTFVSESERKAHNKSQHAPRTKRAG